MLYIDDTVFMCTSDLAIRAWIRKQVHGVWIRKLSHCALPLGTNPYYCQK
jgi:hypothetical protein